MDEETPHFLSAVLSTVVETAIIPTTLRHISPAPPLGRVNPAPELSLGIESEGMTVWGAEAACHHKMMRECCPRR